MGDDRDGVADDVVDHDDGTAPIHRVDTVPCRPAPDRVDPDAEEPEGPRYVDRQASELAYQARVLAMATDPRQPLLERVRFCAFFTTLTDEFFRVRVAGLKDQQVAGVDSRSRGGRTPAQEVRALQDRFRDLTARQRGIWQDQLRPALADEGIVLVAWDDLDDDEQAHLTDVFDDRIFPVLTPLAVGPAHPFPFISDLSLSIGVLLDPDDGGPGFARVKVPGLLERFVAVDDGEPHRMVWVEEVIGAHLDRLFPGRQPLACHVFRVTRNADYDVEDVEVDDLLETVATEIQERRFGRALRLEVDEGMPADLRRFLADELGLSDEEVFAVPTPLDLGALDALYDLDRPDLRHPVRIPVDAPVFADDDLFGALRDHDVLVQHPYESFTTSTLRFLERAAVDPRVLAIKQTLYRTSGDSPVVEAIIRAADEGKQVAVLVELKARFDEAANIEWARELEEAGVHVVFGFVDLKTHTKTLLVVREDPDGVIRRYGHLATGNYNPSTARAYEDLGLFTADEALTDDLGQLFNMLTGQSRDLQPARLLVAPSTLRPRLVELIRSQAHADGRIVIKVNHLSHVEVIEALYHAARAGADIDLVVRTICCLRPDVPGLSPGLRVRSVVGPILEHSRIYRFGHDPEPGAYLLGSADLMPRNLDNRVEAVAPVDDPDLRARLDEVLEALLADEALSWCLDGDGLWTRVDGDRNAQEDLARAAHERSRP